MRHYESVEIKLCTQDPKKGDHYGVWFELPPSPPGLVVRLAVVNDFHVYPQSVRQIWYSTYFNLHNHNYFKS